MEENRAVIREPKTFYFDFDQPKNVDKNVKQEIGFMIKRNLQLRIKQKMKLNNQCIFS